MGTDNAWTVSDHLLAQVVDVLSVANWQRAGGKGSQPDPVKRPHDLKELKEKRTSLLDRATRFKQRQANRAEMLTLVPGIEGAEDE